MTPSPSSDRTALRRGVLAVCVVDGIDLEPRDDGVVLPGGTRVAWDDLDAAVGLAAPDGELGRIRLLSWLRARAAVARWSAAELALRARPLGLPVDHALHPGPGWVRERVLGGVLDIGLGLIGSGPDPDAVEPLPDGVVAAAGLETGGWWTEARDYLERMGAVAAARLLKERPPVLRPIGDCDVVTLLGSAVLRTAMCAGDPSGMCAAAVPMRRRGWLELSRTDPAFAPAAAAATAPTERGFPRPLLVTVDEVTVAPEGGRPQEIVLRDPAAVDLTRTYIYR